MEDTFESETSEIELKQDVLDAQYFTPVHSSNTLI